MNNRILEQCLENNYNRKDFITLAREIIPFKVAEPIPIEITSAEEEKVESFNYLGTVQIEDKNIYLLEVELKNTSLVRSPTFQRNLVAKYLKSKLADAAIVSFYSKDEPSWKLSLVTITYKLEESGKVKEELSEAKRFSFIVGKSQPIHTAIEQLSSLSGKLNSYQDILDAFSVERVTKDFFIKVASAFRELVGGKEKINGRQKDFGEGVLKLPVMVKKIKQEFAIRLINRLIFSWFLKKKKLDTGRPLVSDRILSSKSVLEYKKIINSKFKRFITGSYYHDIIEPLFFEVMNKPCRERLDKYKSIKEFADIPFLNGGLFEPRKGSDFYELNEVTYVSKYFNMVKIPDEWFKNFFEVLETYNFTVDENTPVDVELSIDPEMLGRIFENLLAEINPETGETARKSTGSYYTPRTIVEFMVNESLKHYLIDKTKISESKIENLLSYASEESLLTEEENDKVLEALNSLKILDPACGSGAFPMGVLQKMLLILQKVDPGNEKWFEKFIEKIPDPLMKEETRKKFKDEDLDYIRKLAILQHSIYGVDIQPMATEISRLRAFLSLIVDAKIDSKKDNMGVEPLPNLDFKFVTANSLIDIEKIVPEETGQLIKDPFFEKFEELTQKYFIASSTNKKDRIRKQIEALIDDKVKEKLDHIQDLSKVLDSRFGISKEKSKLIEKLNYEANLWRSYKNIFKNEPVGFFNTKYFFPDVKNGFDIVIANPPYIQLQKAFNETKKYADLYKNQGYETFDRTGDIYCLFYERGLNLLKEKGILTYITSNKWMRAKYGSKLRKFFSRFNPKIIIDLGPNVFETATVDTSILLIQKIDDHNQLKGMSLSGRSIDNLSIYFNENAINLPSFQGEPWIIGSAAEQKLKEKIENIGTPLKEWDVKIYRGIVTGLNRAFIINEETKQKILSNCKTKEEKVKTEKIIVPTLKGRNIKKYFYNWNKKYMILAIRNINIENYPSLKKYLLNYEEKLKMRKGTQKWYELQASPSGEKLNELLSYKIAYPDITDGNKYTIINGNTIGDNTVYFICHKNISILKYLISILNSTFLKFILNFYANTLGGEAQRSFTEFIKNIPIPKISEEKQQPFIDLVDKISHITSQKDYEKCPELQAKVREYERQIDQLVYKLYNLTPEEIKIVEESTK